MTKPRRAVAGPVSIDVRSCAPRRGIVEPSLRDKLLQSQLLPSPAALATTATVCTLAVATATTLAVPAAASTPAQPFSASVTEQSDSLVSATPSAYVDGRVTLDQVRTRTIEVAVKAAAEKAAADQAAAAASKAAADKAAAAKAAADKATANKVNVKKATTTKLAKSVSAPSDTTPAPSKPAPAPSGNYGPASRIGLKGGAVKTYNVIMSTFSGINSVGGYRPHSLSNHQRGLAIDFMITPGAEDALGWSIAKYLAAHASELNIDHIIFKQRIWTPRNPTWRMMENRGSSTANHMDHVHVSMKG